MMHASGFLYSRRTAAYWSDGMADCETEVVNVTYFVDVEFDDVSGVQRFGPASNVDAADSLLIALASRSDVKKATRVRELES